MKPIGTLAAACAIVATVAATQAATISSGATIPSGTTIRTVLDRGIDSSALTDGSNFKLLIDDPAQSALAGAAIHGHVTDVTAPSGMTRARIGFILDYISFKNGTRAAIHAVVLSRNVTQTNTAVARQEAVKFSLPPMTVGATPGPIAWQMHFRQGAAPSVTPRPAGNTSGYVYAQKSNETIVIPPGSPVTIQLTSGLTAP